jgi:hypothetical protein
MIVYDSGDVNWQAYETTSNCCNTLGILGVILTGGSHGSFTPLNSDGKPEIWGGLGPSAVASYPSSEIHADPNVNVHLHFNPAQFSNTGTFNSPLYNFIRISMVFRIFVQQSFQFFNFSDGFLG